MKPDDIDPDWSSLEAYREDIDSIDNDLISLLAQRQEVAAAIGKFKKDRGMKVIDPAREEAVLGKLTAKSQGRLSKDFIRHIFNEIFSASRAAQEPLAVAFLGPEATFSHQAAISLFGRSTSYKAADSFEDIFAMVEKGMCQKGIVPIENSYEGSINRNLDLLHNYNLKISAELHLRIRNHLLSKANEIKETKHLYSHPMPIAQCCNWIKNNLKGMLVNEVASTSLAAKMAADDHEALAIGSRLSALKYGLNILKENIEDQPENITRFLVIGKTDSQPTGRDKTSIIFSLSHRPGTLFKVMEVLARKNINMSRIESRPMRTRNWEYLFFVDLEGHEQDQKVHEAMQEMERHCAFFKKLGSYPAAGNPNE